jgi:hypothetical protein
MVGLVSLDGKACQVKSAAQTKQSRGEMFSEAAKDFTFGFNLDHAFRFFIGVKKYRLHF